MPSLPNMMQALGALGSFLLAVSLVLSPLPATTNPASPAAGSSDLAANTLDASASAAASPVNNKVSTCDVSTYPTPTPPATKPPTPHKSPIGANNDSFGVEEAQQMPSGPSAFTTAGKLKASATAPKLPPPPAGQFSAPYYQAGASTTATPRPYINSTPVPTLVPATPRRVVIQAGHWQNSNLPYQLSEFRGDGTYAAGKYEWQVNLDVANRAASILRGRGYAVAVVPATVPIDCQADAFVALHADGDSSASVRGFKSAYPQYINNPLNRRFLADMYIEYGSATGLARSYSITRNMTGYYAFYNRRQPYAADPSTPMLILEMGYMSNATDRRLLFNQPGTVALGVANGIDRFLQGK
jgi:N-acetylmuramoyl-L-alanine amidase